MTDPVVGEVLGSAARGVEIRGIGALGLTVGPDAVLVLVFPWHRETIETVLPRDRYLILVGYDQVYAVDRSAAPTKPALGLLCMRPVDDCPKCACILADGHSGACDVHCGAQRDAFGRGIGI